MQQEKTRKIGSILRLTFSLLVIAAAAWIFFNQQFVLDEIALRRYSPNAEIVQLADSTSMSKEGRRYFYASHPEINDASSFNRNCYSHGEESIVLGCYTQRRIFLYDVTDERISGVKEVTAAHEMLHAAYDRLSTSDKQRINAIVEREMNTVTNERIKSLITLYQNSNPAQLPNEMHSILATEVVELSDDLEDHYARYFTDRQAVVGYSKQYESVFADIQGRQDQLMAELEQLNQTIKQRSDALNGKIVTLNADIQAFNQRARDGGFGSQSEFNAARAGLVARQSSLRKDRDEIDSLISIYNAKRNELIELNGEVESLNQSLDSTPNDIPSL